MREHILRKEEDLGVGVREADMGTRQGGREARGAPVDIGMKEHASKRQQEGERRDHMENALIFVWYTPTPFYVVPTVNETYHLYFT